jgi:tetratricopeptide (TPR) repeat protein
MLELQSNNLERAERILQQTVQHFLKYKLVRYASEGINMLGDVHRKNGQFQKAERYYMNAIMKMEQINHPELIIPQLNLSILRLEKGEFSQIRAELVRTIPDLEANNKNTLALFARVILLVAQVNLQEVTFAKENLNQISSLLKQTSLFEFDIAVLLNKAATCISKDEKKSLKLRILRLVKEQYIGLNRPEEVQGIEQRINILRTDQTR